MLHKLDMLYTIYLGLFKYITNWIQEFLKKLVQQQTIDNAWKA